MISNEIRAFSAHYEALPIELQAIIALLDDACPFCFRKGRCSFEKERGPDCLFFTYVTGRKYECTTSD